MAFVLLFVIVVAAAIGLTLIVVPEHERAVVFRLGRVRGAFGPGVVFILRGLDQAKRVTTKVIVGDLPVGDVITRDDIPIQVEATIYFRVTDPEKAVLEVDNYRVATAHAAHAEIRAHLGEITSDRVLHEQRAVNAELTALITARTAAWGVDVERAELRDVEADLTSVRGRLRFDEPAEFGDF